MERIVRFGPEGQLVGLLTGEDLPDDALTVVLPSAGLLPRSGPFRLHVELARRLQAKGIRTFRFESPGVGETPRIRGWGSREATIAAIEHLAAHHRGSHFVVGGVCSAADAGWAAAVADARVTGLLMLDGLAFTGPWYQFARVLDVLRRPPSAWIDVARRWMQRTRVSVGKATTTSADYRDWPAPDAARQQFAQLVERGVASLWIYTGGYGDNFLHEKQFAWSFGDAARNGLVDMHFWRDCDHTFYARAHRDRLLDTVERWLLGRVRPGVTA